MCCAATLAQFSATSIRCTHVWMCHPELPGVVHSSRAGHCDCCSDGRGMQSSGMQGLALSELGTNVHEGPVPAVVCKASHLTQALDEVARLSVEKPLGCCEIFFLYFVCVHPDSTVVPVPEQLPTRRDCHLWARCTKVVLWTPHLR